jgi:hypothetical protein
MSEWQKFHNLVVMGEFKRTFEPVIEKRGKELGEAIWNDLFELDGPTNIDRQINPSELFLGKVLHGLLEISLSAQNLQDIAIYISTFPYRNKSVTKPAYLRYHVENYFEKMYILKERLVKYLRIIDKSYKKDQIYKPAHLKIEHLSESVEKSLESFTKIRGQHIHRNRFHDEDLNRLDVLDSLTTSGNKDIIEVLPDYYKLKYKNVRQKWSQIIRKNNKAITELLDFYAKTLIEIMFDSNTHRLIYPSVNK